jgi:hypothetical protein
MLRYLYFLLLFILLSCNQGLIIDQDPIIDPENENQEMKSTNFFFSGIEYVVNDKRSVKDIVKEQPSIILNNNTSETQTYIFNPKKNIFEVMTFWSADTRAHSFVDSQQRVKVPINISDKGVITYDDGTKWSYSARQKIEPSIESCDTITIKPNHKLTLIASFHLREIETSYNLHLKGSEFGEEINIGGKWAGLFVLDYNIDYKIDSLQ